MTIVQLIADLRKTARRIRRRGHLVGLQQLQAWQRRLARLKARFAAITGREWRRQAFTMAGAAALVLGLNQTAQAGGTIRYTQTDPGLTLLKSSYSTYGEYSQATFADIDGDGDLDAFAVNENSDVLFWRNDGTKTRPKFVEVFGSARPFDFTTYYAGFSGYGDDKGITAGDIDDDGDVDLVVGGGLHYFLFYKNQGTKTAPNLDLNYSYYIGSGDNPFMMYAGRYSKPVLADMDGDGDLDLLISDYYNVRYYKNQGTKKVPDFQYVSYSSSPFTGLYHSGGAEYLTVAAGDLDGDGDVDVVVGGKDSYYLDLWKNTGTVTNPVFSNQGPLPVFNYYWFPSLADYDGDGDLDLVTGSYYNGLQNFENKGGKFSQPFPQYNMGDSPLRADVDSDGDIDVLQQGYLWRNNNGALQLEYYYLFHYYADVAPAFADLDGDGDNDLVARQGSSLRYFRKDGARGSLQFTELSGGANPFNGVNVAGNWDECRLVDMDGDLDLDAVLAYYDAGGTTALKYLRNDGTPSAPTFSLQTGSNDPFNGLAIERYSRPLIEDLDHDGDLDLLSVAYYLGEDRLYVNVGSNVAPSFVLQPSVFSDRTKEGTPILVDFDNDGDTDVVFANYDDFNFYMMRNDSDRFTKVDPAAVDKNKPVLGPVPAVSGQDVCIYLPANAQTMDVDLYNLAGEKVLNGLSGVTAGTGCFKATLAPGLYMAKITVDGKSTMQKIIISK